MEGMMTDYETHLYVDPGMTTGLSLWSYREDAPIQRLDYWAVPLGMIGMETWMSSKLGRLRPDLTVCERFDRNEIVPGVVLEPLPIEGLLYGACMALGLELEMQERVVKAMCSDETLKRSGLWLTGDDVGHIDARDVNDTQRHALGRAKAHGHIPTIEAYWPDPAQ
jgi:hypothetical protein